MSYVLSSQHWYHLLFGPFWGLLGPLRSLNYFLNASKLMLIRLKKTFFNPLRKVKEKVKES